MSVHQTWFQRRKTAMMTIWPRVLWSIFFFFQAEDGIRDLTVTGVQTCALPIYRATSKGSGGGRAVGPARGPVPRSRIHSERRGPAARAGAGVPGNGAWGDRRLAHGVSAARHRVPPHPDRHAVRYGASAARVTFLHPVALVGLVAAAIPALLHLLERRVPPEAEFPPLRYLSEAERQSARRLKLRHLLLLLLRTALIALVVLAAARPLFPTQASSGSLHEPTALVVILDNSASSGLVVDGHPGLQRLKAMARGSLAGAAAPRPLWLVLADGVARAGTRDALLATVDSAAVSARRPGPPGTRPAAARPGGAPAIPP